MALLRQCLLELRRNRGDADGAVFTADMESTKVLLDADPERRGLESPSKISHDRVVVEAREVSQGVALSR